MSNDPFETFRAASKPKQAAGDDDTPDAAAAAAVPPQGESAASPFAKFASAPPPAAASPPQESDGEPASGPFGKFSPAPRSATPARASGPFGEFARPDRQASRATTPPPACPEPASGTHSQSVTAPTGTEVPASAPPSTAPSEAAPRTFDLNLFTDGDAATVAGPVLTSHGGVPAEADQPPHRVPPVILQETPALAAGAAPVLGEGGTPAVVALSRAQSGIGTLRVSLASPAKDRLHLGLLAEDTDGVQTVIGPASEAFYIAAVEPDGEVAINLRRVRELRRALVYVTAKSADTPWQGMVTASLPSGTKVHAPIAYAHPAETTAVLSILVVDGRMVLRAECDHVEIPLRDMARRYGYSRVAWVDGRTPVGFN